MISTVTSVDRPMHNSNHAGYTWAYAGIDLAPYMGRYHLPPSRATQEQLPGSDSFALI